MNPTQIVIEDWDGDGGIRIHDAMLPCCHAARTRHQCQRHALSAHDF